LFRKNGYSVYLVDEFRTSCKCSNCEDEKGDCIKFRTGRNPKPNKNNSILKHGVLICKKCNAVWNRDENSSRNIYKIAYNAINKIERPVYMCRQKRVDDDENNNTVLKIVKTKKLLVTKSRKNCKAVVSSTSSVGKLQCHI
jgi:hypothetical protein